MLVFLLFNYALILSISFVVIIVQDKILKDDFMSMLDENNLKREVSYEKEND